MADLLDLSSKEAKDASLEKAIKIYEKSFKNAMTERLRSATPIGIGGSNGAVNQLQNQIAKNIRGGLN